MTRPLYANATRDPRIRPTDGHAGLWFDKFCDQWRVTRGSWSMKSEGDDSNNPKLRWIDTVTGVKVGSRGEIDEYVSRLVRLVRRHGGIWRVFTADSRFVTGLGRSHPVENGFAWHPTLGTPYLPGSSVKGLVRNWAELDANPKPPCGAVGHLLGNGGAAGRIGFLDAVPIVPVVLEADVMTPHFAGWNEQDPPGDWRSPTPIPFLVTAPRTSFLFSVVPCREVGDDELNMVADWLADGLAWGGAGAKTSVGYGRFERDVAVEEAMESKYLEHEERAKAKREERLATMARTKRLAALTPVEREIEDILDARQDKNMPGVTAIVKEVQSGRWGGTAKMEVAKSLKARMKEDNDWKEISRKKKPAKDKAFQRTLLVKGWLGGG